MAGTNGHLDTEVRGTVKSVRGSVIDVVFGDRLPEIRDLVWLGVGIAAGVSAHVDISTVRCLAMNRTQGLARGDPAVSQCRR